jgi:hypothetical protein
MTQIDLQLTGSALRDIGMSHAVDHANRVSNGWSDRALEALWCYLREVPDPFMTEQFRRWSTSYGLDAPPHQRAYGSVMVRAKRHGMIKFVRYAQVETPTSHRATASMWVRV